MNLRDSTMKIAPNWKFIATKEEVILMIFRKTIPLGPQQSLPRQAW